MSVPPGRARLEPGFRLDRYELLCPIAHGGMASVWLARLVGKHGFEKLVAVKTILPDRAEDPHFRHMFLDEARIASGIDHANVAHILDLGEENDLLYLVMEWIDGDSLSKLHRAAEKRGRRIPLGVVMRVLADAASGLHAAHELKDQSGRTRSVVHRDVSPQNILVSSQGNAKLIDFGIAKAVDRLTQTIASAGPALKGKIGYMAPEQAMGHELDRRTDVWALGAVLYFLLAGTAPFVGPNDVATLFELTRGKPPPPLPANVPRPVQALTFELLAHLPSARPATASDVQRRLEQLMNECNVLTTTADVARYVEEQLAERADARRKAVSMALEAAKDRVKLDGLLASGGAEVSTATEPRPPPRPLPELSPGSSGHNTSATLGSAAVVYARTGPTAADAATRRLWAAVAGVGGALGLVVLFVVAVVLVRAHATSNAAATVPEVTTEPPATPITPPPMPVVTGVIAPIASQAPVAPPTSATPSASASAATARVVKPAAPTGPAVKHATTSPTTTSKKGAVDDGF